MDHVKIYIKRWFIIPRAFLRLCFILLNNIYCIPTYVVWMVLLSPLRRIHPETFWKIEGQFFHWLLAMVSMWSWSAGYEIVEVGDNIEECLNKRTLVIANHQSTGDVPLLMAVFNAKKAILPNIMWIMDSLFKYTNFGIVSVIHQDFFIMSGKSNREKSLQHLVSHIVESYIPRQRKWMVLFPEGGFLRKRRAVSQKFAEKNNLPLLNNVTLPRVGAMKAIMGTIGPETSANNNSAAHEDLIHKYRGQLEWVLDITIGYPKGEPLDLLTIVFGTRPPCRTMVLYRLYPCNQVPQDTEEMTQWLYKRFEEKEKMLDYFYTNGDFPVSQYCKDAVQPQVVAQDCLRFLILHLFFITSTYVHAKMLMAAYNLCNSFIY